MSAARPNDPRNIHRGNSGPPPNPLLNNQHIQQQQQQQALPLGQRGGPVMGGGRGGCGVVPMMNVGVVGGMATPGGAGGPPPPIMSNNNNGVACGQSPPPLSPPIMDFRGGHGPRIGQGARGGHHPHQMRGGGMPGGPNNLQRGGGGPPFRGGGRGGGGMGQMQHQNGRGRGGPMGPRMGSFGRDGRGPPQMAPGVGGTNMPPIGGERGRPAPPLPPPHPFAGRGVGRGGRGSDGPAGYQRRGSAPAHPTMPPRGGPQAPLQGGTGPPPPPFGGLPGRGGPPHLAHQQRPHGPFIPPLPSQGGPLGGRHQHQLPTQQSFPPPPPPPPPTMRSPHNNHLSYPVQFQQQQQQQNHQLLQHPLQSQQQSPLVPVVYQPGRPLSAPPLGNNSHSIPTAVGGGFPTSNSAALPGFPTAQHQQHPQHVGYVPGTAPPTTTQHDHSLAQQQQQQQQSVAFTQEQIEQAWTEHDAPNGMKYYYNSLSKESTYSKPEALKKKEQQQQQQQQNYIEASKTATQKSTNEWKEYVDKTTGKTYYSNGVTTTWEKPIGVGNGASVAAPTTTAAATGLAASTLAGATTTATAGASNVSSHQGNDEGDGETSRKNSKSKKRKKDTEFSSKEEAIRAFKGLLLAKDIAPTLKWHEVGKICSLDSRWEACEDVLSTGERKQALAEYQTKRANELRNIERQERVRAKEMFVQFLSESLPNIDGFSAWNSRFGDVRNALSKDDRFHAIADEPTRESLFIDFCEEFRKRDERKKRNKRREAQDAFLAFLWEKNEYGVLSYSSTWKSFEFALDDKDKADSRFAISPFMSDEDRQIYFADFVIELQATEDDKRRRIRDAQQRAELEQRDAFRLSLSELAVQGKLLPASRWRTIEELVLSLPTYAHVQAQDREAPREIFEEFALDWNNIYRRDRTFLSQLVFPSSKSDAMVKSETTYQDFTKALLERASESPDFYGQTRMIINREEPVSSARLYFNELSLRSRGLSGPAIIRRGRSLRRKDSDSSEDEGEIVEDGELPDIMAKR